MSTQPIRLYDIATKAGPQHPLAVNPWKARITLNYLGVPHESKYISMSQIENESKLLGVPPTGTKPKRLGDLFTVPFIFDPRENRYLPDSFVIAHHLEKVYGESKSGTLFPWPQSEDEAFVTEHHERVVLGILVPLLGRKVTSLITDEGIEYMRRSRVEWFGKTLEEVTIGPKESERRREGWVALRTYLDEPQVVERAEAAKKGITFRDIVLGATLKWTQLAAEPGEFEEVLEWDDGRWGKFFSELDKYTAVH